MHLFVEWNEVNYRIEIGWTIAIESFAKLVYKAILINSIDTVFDIQFRLLLPPINLFTEIAIE